MANLVLAGFFAGRAFVRFNNGNSEQAWWDIGLTVFNVILAYIVW